MKSSDYRRFTVGLLSPPKIAKTGIRAAIRTKRAVNICHAIDGLYAETGELLLGLQDVILGQRMKPEMLPNLREELGDIMFFLTVLSRELRVKQPAYTKKVNLKQTRTKALLQLNAEATHIADLKKKMYYGQELDLDKIKMHVAQAQLHAYNICFQFFGEGPQAIIDQNVAKLMVRYPNGFTSTDAKNRDVKAEGEAATAKGKPSTKSTSAENSSATPATSASPSATPSATTTAAQSTSASSPKAKTKPKAATANAQAKAESSAEHV